MYMCSRISINTDATCLTRVQDTCLSQTRVYSIAPRSSLGHSIGLIINLI